MNNWFNARNRRWIYSITIAVIAILVGYDVLTESQAPLWLALAAAILGVAAPVTALKHVTPDKVEVDMDFPEEGHADYDDPEKGEEL